MTFYDLFKGIEGDLNICFELFVLMGAISFVYVEIPYFVSI